VTAGVFFDVDGTLVDTAYFHTVAWLRACRELGVPATAARLHRLIGMGGDQFVRALTGGEMPGLDEAHSRHMQPFEAEAQPFAGASDLIRELHRQGAHVAVSTSGGRDAATKLLELVVPDLTVIDTLVTRDEIAATKPAPDLVAVALQRSGLDPDRVLYVGDTAWDVEAAARCGVGTIGVLTGGWAAAELLDAGAVAVYESVGELLEQLADSPVGALLRT